MLVRTNLIIIQHILVSAPLRQHEEQVIPQEEETIRDEDLIHDLKSSLNSTSTSQQDQHFIITIQPQQLVKKISSLLFSRPSTSNLSSSSALFNRPIPTVQQESKNTSSIQDTIEEEQDNDDDESKTIYYKRREDYYNLPKKSDDTPQKTKRALSIHKVLGKATAKIYPGTQQKNNQQDGMPVFKPSDNKTKALFKRIKTLVKHRKK